MQGLTSFDVERVSCCEASPVRVVRSVWAVGRSVWAVVKVVWAVVEMLACVVV